MKKPPETIKASAGRVLILVENAHVPFDPRVWNEARALTEAGYKVSVICPKGRNYDTEAHVVLRGVSIYRYAAREARSGLLSYLLEYFQALIKMTLLCVLVHVREGFDVVQLCNPPDLLFLVAFPYKLLGKNIIFDQHDLSPELYLTKTNNRARGIIHRALLLLEKATYKTADVIISTNESYKKIAISRGGLVEPQVVVVRSGPDLKRIKVVKENQELRRGKRYLVLYVGTMAAQDGVDYLLRSVDYLLHEHKRYDFHVLVIGGGAELEKLKRYSRELRIDDAVTFTGRVPDRAMIEALSTADVCVCPDPKTPLNDVSTMNKTLEYMAVGKPIVAYDLCETRVSARNAALYATPNSERDFGDKIDLLLDSPDLRSKLGKLGKDRIYNGLSWEYSKQQLYKAYEMALGKLANNRLAKVNS